MQIGSSIGAEQAAQRFREQQDARQKQQDAQAQARWEAEFGLQAQAAARTYAARQEYQKRVAAGEDPLKVLMEVGPAAGISGAAQAAAIRSALTKPKAAVPPPSVQWVDLPNGKRVPYLVDAASGRGTWLPSGYMPDAKEGQLSQEDREQLRDLRSERDVLRKKYANAIDAKLAQKMNPEAFKEDQDRLAEINNSIAELTGVATGDTTPPAGTPPPGQSTFVFDRAAGKLVPRTASTPPAAAGAPAAAAPQVPGAGPAAAPVVPAPGAPAAPNIPGPRLPAAPPAPSWWKSLVGAVAPPVKGTNIDTDPLVTLPGNLLNAIAPPAKPDEEVAETPPDEEGSQE